MDKGKFLKDDEEVVITGKELAKHRDICRKEGAIKELELLEQAFRNGDTNTCSFKSFLLWKKQRLKVLGGNE